MFKIIMSEKKKEIAYNNNERMEIAYNNSCKRGNCPK